MTALHELRRIPGLHALPEEELSVLALVVSRREFVPGAIVVEQGASSRSCFFLASGELEVLKSIAGTSRFLNRLSEGTIFGQIGLILGPPRTASVVAKTPAVVYELKRTDYDSLLDSGRPVALQVQEQVVVAAIRQLRNATNRLGVLQDRKERATGLRDVRDGLSDWDIEIEKAEVSVSPGGPPRKPRQGR